MIPSYFHQMFNFNAKILSYKNGEYPYLEKYCNGISLNFVKKNRIFNLFSEISVLKYLFLNARKIDILNLIIFTDQKAVFGVFYKLLRRNGFLYLKLDADKSFKKRDIYLSKAPSFNGILKFFKYLFIKKINTIFLNVVDLISVESKYLYNYLKEKYPGLRKKLIYLPNGIDDFYIKNVGIKRLQFNEKENIILTVGRIGTEVKSTETLLKAISKIKNLTDWKVILIGPVEKHFNRYIEDFFKKYPFLKDKVLFIGEITDRKKLFEYYQKSKIFCLTSKHESFGIVLVEAAYFGNYIISSKFPSAKDITMNGSFGTLFKPGDSDELAYILQKLINDERYLKENFLKIQKYAEKNYFWSKLIHKLYREILKRWKK